MPKFIDERRLRDVTERLKRARHDLSVTDEQLRLMHSDAEDLRIRALVSETPMAGREHEQAQKHIDAMARSQQSVIAAIAELENAQNQLLERLAEAQR